MHETQHHSNPGERDYEDRDIPLSKVAIIGIYTALFTGLTLFALKIFFLKNEEKITQHDAPVSIMATERVLPSKPVLQVNEKRSWDQELAVQKERLTGYAWVDKQAGIVKIPIERAIDILAEKGLPARDAKK